jgi:hypothetical protein
LLRAVEFVRTGTLPVEIKNALQTVNLIEQDASLDEALRFIVPRAAYGAMYTLRTKRNAVHVKGIDPQPIDASLCVQTASWSIAELLRLFHTDDPILIADTMAGLTRNSLPYVEKIEQETIVTGNVSCEVELLLLLANWKATGADRRLLGESSKFKPSSVTGALDKLQRRKFVHRSGKGIFHITGTGELELARQMGGLALKQK